MTATTWGVLFIGSLCAGWVDAIVGGGGLILLPIILMLNPGFSNAQALSVNKLAAVAGTINATYVLTRKVPGSLRALRYAPLAMLGSAGGALVASLINKNVMRPFIIVLLVGVGIFMVLRPDFGSVRDNRLPPRFAKVGILILVGAVAFYDGIFGPGTGVFFIMGFTTLLATDFLKAAAWAKVLNTSTNIGALVAFALTGEIMWALGLSLAVANVIGAQIGARMVIVKGTAFMRIVILIVVLVMSIKLGYDYYHTVIAGA